MEAEILCLFAKSFFVALRLFLVFDEEDGLIVWLAGGEQVIEDAASCVRLL